MPISASDVISLSQARANLSELADQVKAGAEKIITKNGESYVALIDARRLDYFHQLEQECLQRRLMDDAGHGLADIAEGRVNDAHIALSAIKHLLDAGLTAMEQTLADRRQFVLDKAQWQAFQEALDRPVQGKPRLKKLLREPGILG